MSSPLQHPPGPIGWPLVGVLPEFRRDPAKFLLRTAEEYGDVSYFRLGLQRVYFLNRPDLIEEVLVTHQGNFTKSRILQRARTLLGEGLLTAEGETHLKQRRLTQPSFTRDRLADYASTMVDAALSARERWRTGDSLDVGAEMMRLTLDIVGRTLFGAAIESDAAGIGKALTDVIGTFGVMLTPGAGLLQHLPLPAMRRARRAQRYLDRYIERLIAERRAQGCSEGDLLSSMLAAENEGDGRLSNRQIRDHALTFLLAGHETTAAALTWTWYLLAQNPDIDARMRSEIETVLRGRKPGFEDVERLEYTTRVFLETLRLYPPAWAIGRMSRQSMRLFNYLLRPGSICVMSPYVMHRHPRFWPDPELFDPDRFTPGRVAARPRFSYFPFGGGTRTCIGERFAMTEGVLLLAAIAQRWQFRLVPGHVVEPRALITLRPKRPMRMIVTPAPVLK